MATFPDEMEPDGQEDEVDGRFTTVDYLFKSGFNATDEEAIRAEVYASKTLGWSWSVVNCGVYHTAVVIHLDGKPRYSVNWGPKTGTSTFKLSGDVEGEITLGIEKEDDAITAYKNVLGSVSVPENLQDSEIDKILNQLLTFSESKYHIVSCNCRDHVLGVLGAVGVASDELSQVQEEIDAIRTKAERMLKKVDEMMKY